MTWSKRARTKAGRIDYCNRRLADFVAHPELATLGDVERALHGYDPAKAHETPFTDDEDDA